MSCNRINYCKNTECLNELEDIPVDKESSVHLNTEEIVIMFVFNLQ